MKLDLITWDITSKCNLRCAHCYNAEKYFKEGRKDLSYEKCLELIDRVKSLGFKTINFLGGEPLVRKDFLDIASYAIKQGFNVTLTSNGTFLTKKMYKDLEKIGIKQLCISVDGGSEKSNDIIRGKGTFAQVCKNLEEIKDSHRDSELKLYVSYTLTQNNSNDLTTMIDFCRRYKIKYLIIGTLVNAGNGHENFNDLYTENEYVLKKIEEAIEYTLREYPELKLQIDCRPVLNYYLESKYGLEILQNRTFINCSYLMHSLYIESDGSLHPCNVFNMKGTSLNNDKYRQYDNVTIFDTLDKINKKLNFFNDEYKKNLKNMCKLEFCNTCQKKAICKVCPFQFNSLDKYYDCIYAHKRLSDLYEQSKKWEISFIKNSESNLKYGNSFLNKLDVNKTLLDNYSLSGIDIEYIKFFDLIIKLERNKFLTIKR